MSQLTEAHVHDLSSSGINLMQISPVLLVMFNKAALSSYSFPSANVITLLQMICSCSLLYALRRWRLISFTNSDSFVISDTSNTSFVPFGTLVHTLPLALTYLLYMLVSMESVRGVNVPVYTTLRRTTVGIYNDCGVNFGRVEIYTSYFWKDVASVGLIILGAFIAGARDLLFDFYEYGIVFTANIATTVYLATISRIGGILAFVFSFVNSSLLA